MNYKNYALVMFAVLISSVSFSSAFATHISGTVENDFNQPLDGAFVTSECIGNYNTATTDSNGDYSVGPNCSGSVNSVQANQYFFDRERQTSVANSATGIDFDLSTITSETVDIWVMNDEGKFTQSAIENHIAAAEEKFKLEHSINFDVVYYSSWNPSDETTCGDAYTTARSTANWPTTNHGAEVLIATYDDSFTDGYACTVRYTSSGNDPSIILANDSGNYPRTIMHEFGHSYSLTHDYGCTNPIPHVMLACGQAHSDYVMNFNNTSDDDVHTNRSWY